MSFCVINENDCDGVLEDLAYRIIDTFGMSIAGSRHVDSWGMLGTMAIACAHLSQIIVVRYSRTLVPHCLVFTTKSTEHHNSHGTIVKVNCEAIIFEIDEGWITREAFVFIFSFKNPWIQCVKQSRNNAAICLVPCPKVTRIWKQKDKSGVQEATAEDKDHESEATDKDKGENVKGAGAVVSNNSENPSIEVDCDSPLAAWIEIKRKKSGNISGNKSDSYTDTEASPSPLVTFKHLKLVDEFAAIQGPKSANFQAFKIGR
uniref:Uncharacterized protein n=1 Tax=Daucus carota subsp. sativus TaxID=79200 RepID=A0A162AI39_DAUCS